MVKNNLKGKATVIPFDELKEPITVYVQPPKKKNYPDKWFIVWQKESEIGVSMTEQAEANILTLTEYRVRDWLLGTIGIGNYVYVNQSEMAKKLKIEKATASRAIKKLIELNILVRGPKMGRSNTYMINPAFCFSGNYEKGLQERKAIITQFKSELNI